MRVVTAVLTFVLALSASLTSGASASADARTSAVQNCDGHTLVSANFVRRFSDNKAVGAIQLCRAGNHWFSMFIYYGDSLPSGHIGNARKWFVRNWEVLDEQNCADYSGYAAGSDTSCTTPKDYPTGDPTQERRGEGELLHYVNGRWVEYARGYTLLCNFNACH